MFSNWKHVSSHFTFEQAKKEAEKLKQIAHEREKKYKEERLFEEANPPVEV